MEETLAAEFPNTFPALLPKQQKYLIAS